MQAGKLRHRITIQQKGAGRTSSGAEQEQWSTFAQTWAGFDPRSGQEFVAAGQLQGKSITAITIRYRAEIKAKMRVLFGTRIFDIQWIKNVEERNREMLLICEELHL
jgi:SPP1 family predicted phage head-tail adaptor